MNDLYPLLYVPLLGLVALCLIGGGKFKKEHRQHSRETWVKIGGALLAVALFTGSYAVMAVTHARAFNVAMLLVMVMALVNFLRTTLFLNWDITKPDE